MSHSKRPVQSQMDAIRHSDKFVAFIARKVAEPGFIETGAEARALYDSFRAAKKRRVYEEFQRFTEREEDAEGTDAIMYIDRIVGIATTRSPARERWLSLPPEGKCRVLDVYRKIKE